MQGPALPRGALFFLPPRVRYSDPVATFIFKTEPGEYSFDDLVRDGSAVWEGVSSPAALAHLRTARKGDAVLVYHTGSERRIVGLASITSAPYPDPKLDDPRRIVVDLKPGKAVSTPVTLQSIKADPRFKDFALVKQGRLSVIPVPAALDKALRSLAGL